MHHFLVTTYKHADYVEAMMASLVAQYGSEAEFHRNSKVLILDDASPDATSEVLRMLAARHPNIEIFVNEQNRGIGFNRNFLLEWWVSRSPSASDFVLFVDGDDLLPVGALDAKLNAFSRDPSLQVVGGQLGQFFGLDSDKVQPIRTFPVDPMVQPIANIFECHFYISNATFRASVFLDRAVRFPETPTSEDWLFFTMHPLKKLHLPEVTLLYRRHGHNLTTTYTNGEMVFDIRRQARTLSLLSIGIMPSKRDCELLDLIGYLSFQLAWFGTSHLYQPEVRMPWFSLLSENKMARITWTKLQEEIRALLDRIVEANDRIQHFDPVQLRAYTKAILQAANTEIRTVNEAKLAQALGDYVLEV